MAIRLEQSIKIQVPYDYVSHFKKDECIFCKRKIKKKNIDEFRPVSQGGRINKVNCNPCCGSCNSSKNDLCGNDLLNWIKNKGNIKNPIPDDRIYELIKFYEENEKYMIKTDKTITFPEKCSNFKY